MPRIRMFGSPVHIQSGSGAITPNLGFGTHLNSMLVMGDNGVGKTSTVIEPIMSAISFAFGGSGPRGTLASGLKSAGVCNVPYSYVVDVQLDLNSEAGLRNDCCMVGFILDTAAICSDAVGAVKAHGYRFAIPHSSDVYYLDEYRDRQPWEALGLEFATTDGRSRWRVTPYEEMIERIKRVCEGRRADGALFRRIVSQSEGRWESDLGELCQFNVRSWFQLESALVSNEGVDQAFAKARTDESALLDNFVFPLVRTLCIGEETTENVLAEGFDFVRTQVDETKERAFYGEMEDVLGRLPTVRKAAGRLAEAQAELGSRKDSASQVLAMATRSKSRTADRLDALSQESAQLAARVAILENKRASREVRRAEREAAEARAAVGEVEADLRNARVARDGARRKLLFARWSDDAHATEAARSNLAGKVRALETLRQGEGFRRENSIAAALVSLHEERLAEVEGALGDALAAAEASRAAKEAAEGALRDADSALAGAKARLDARAKARDRTFGTILAKARKLGLPSFWNEDDKAVSEVDLDDILSAARKSLDDSRKGLAELEGRLPELESAVTSRRGEFDEAQRTCAAREAELASASASLSRLDKEVARVSGLYGVAQEALSDHEAASSRIESIELQHARLGERATPLRHASDGVTQLLGSIDGGTYGVPPKAVEAIRASGVPVQWGASYLAQMIGGGEETRAASLVEEFHDLLVSVVVTCDEDAARLRDAVSSAGYEAWFEGAVPIYTVDELGIARYDDEGPACVRGGVVAVSGQGSLDLEQVRSEAIRRQEAIEEELAGISDDMETLSAQKDDVKALDRAFYADLSSRGEYVGAVQSAQGSLDAANGDVEAARLALAAAEAAAVSCRESIARASKTTGSLELRVGSLEDVRSLVDDLGADVDALLEARADLDVSSAGKAEAEGKLLLAAQRCADDDRCASDAQRRRDSVSREIVGIIVPDGVTERADGVFDALLVEYRELSMKNGREVSGLQAEVDELQEILSEKEDIERGSYDELLEAAMDAEPPTRSDEMFGEAEIKRLERNVGKEDAVVARCESRLSVLEGQRDKLARLYEERLRAYRTSHGGADPLSLEELSGFSLEQLDDASRRLRASQDGVRETQASISGFETALARLLGAGIEEPRGGGDGPTVTSDEAQSLATEALAGLRAALGRTKAAERGLRTSLNELLKWASTRSGDIQSQLTSLRVVSMAAEGEVSGAKVVQMVDDASRSVELLMSAVRARLKDVGLLKEQLDAELSHVVMKFRKAMRGMVQASDGRLAINVKARSGDGFEKSLATWSAARLEEVVCIAREADGAVSDERIRQCIAKEVLSMRGLADLCATHDAMSSEGRFRLKFRSPRSYDGGKLIAWSDVASGSGGERATVILTVATVLLRTCFVRPDGTYSTGFMLLDNPFANLSADDKLSDWLGVLEHAGMQVIATSMPNPPLVAAHGFGTQYRLERMSSGDGRAAILSEEVRADQSLVTSFARVRNYAIQDRLDIF